LSFDSKSSVPITVLEKLDTGIRGWITDLAREDRLNSTLATFWAIDKQFKQGAPIGEAVSHAVSEIGTRVDSMQVEVENELTKNFQQIIDRNEISAKQLTEAVRDIVREQTDSVMSQVRLLLEQSKTVAEAGALLKEAAGSVQTALATAKIAGVRGEQGEIQTIQALRDAFFGIDGIQIESIGGANETDAIVRFLYLGLEVGRILLEIKSRNTWSNNFLDQVRDDMKRYDTYLAILIADKLPRNAKGKGFSVDNTTGLIVTMTPELVFQTISVFYELHTSVFKLQKKALDIRALVSNKDLIFYLNDNLKCLEDCKKIIDTTKDTSSKIENLTASISGRIQSNNTSIAGILSSIRSDVGESC
jgi:hypothetical protein